MAKMCEERITHTKPAERASVQSKNRLLTTLKTVLPVGVAYKTTENQGFS